MRLFPVVGRELKVASRQRSLYVGRTVFATVSIVITGLFMFFMQTAAPSTMGMSLFYTLSSFTFFYCAMSGIWVTSDCISEEKREGTLGLLFLTDLKGYDVVFGKLAATSLKSVSGLLAVMPVLAIPLLLGSVSPSEFGRLILVLSNTMLLSLSVGIYASVISTKAMRAAFTTLGLMVFFLGAAPILWVLTGLLTNENQPQWVVDKFFFHSAVYGMGMMSERAYSVDSWPFWKSLITNHFFIWGLLITSSIAVASRWQDRPASEAQLKRSKRILEADQGDHQTKAKLRGTLLDKNPVLWLYSRSRLKTLYPWIVFALGGLYWLWGSLEYGRNFYTEPANFIMTAYLSSILVKCWVGAEASQRLTDDRRSGALELLFSTPLKVKDVLHGHWMAILRQFLGPVIFICALTVFFALILLLDSGRMGADDASYMATMFMAHLVLIVMDCLALFWYGLWNSAKARYVNRSISGTIFTVLMLPWIVYTLFTLSFFSMLAFQGRPVKLPVSEEYFMLGTWFFMGLGWSSWLIAHSRKQLLTHLRMFATTRPGDEKLDSDQKNTTEPPKSQGIPYSSPTT